MGASIVEFTDQASSNPPARTYVRFVCMGTIAVKLALACQSSWSAVKRRRKDPEGALLLDQILAGMTLPSTLVFA